MKTYAEATKSRVPSRANDAPAPNALAHQAQLRNSLLRAGVQPRLQIGAANDPLEREADAVAGRVLRMPEPASAAPVGDGPASQMPHISRVQAKASAEPPVSPRLESSLNSLKNGGAPMDASSRAFFEPRFGRDFSGVRIHTDAPAAQMADSLRAKAFTLGNDIAFAADSYSPGATAGRGLLGHELAHVVQQQGMNAASPQAKLVQRESQESEDWKKEYFIQPTDSREIKNRVGAASANIKADVVIIQKLWNGVPADRGGPKKREIDPNPGDKIFTNYFLKPDGICLNKTIGAIEQFQTENIENGTLEIQKVDKHVDPGKQTLALLNTLQGKAATPTPTGTPPAISEINIPQPAPPKDGNTGNGTSTTTATPTPKTEAEDFADLIDNHTRRMIVDKANSYEGMVDSSPDPDGNRKGWELLKSIYNDVGGITNWNGKNKTTGLTHEQEVKTPKSDVFVTSDYDGSNIHWCGLFATFVLNKAGLSNVKWELGNGLNNQLDKKDKANCKPGDVLYIPYRNKAGKQVHHYCILIERINSNELKTMDGNSDNQGICEKNRNLSDVVVCYDVSKPKKPIVPIDPIVETIIR